MKDSQAIDKDSLSHNIYNFEDTTKIIPLMIETNTSKFKNIDNEVIINKISKVAKKLNFTNDKSSIYVFINIQLTKC